MLGKWVKEPDIYRVHRACVQYTTKGKTSPMVLAVSTGRLLAFSTSRSGLAPQELMWSIEVAKLTGTASYEDHTELLAISAPGQFPATKVKAESDDLTISFFSEGDRAWLKSELACVFFYKTKKPLPHQERTFVKKSRSLKSSMKKGYLAKR